MIKVLVGDLFASKAQTLVNTVNCVGVMGKGVALEFKKRFPDMFQDYVSRCERKEVRLGQPYLYKRLVPPYVLNFPTKDHWRSVANLADIVRGLEYLRKNYAAWGITSMAIPPLGCGQGQLEWRVVGPTLYRFFQQMSIPTELYAPYGTPHDELRVEFLDGTITDRSQHPPKMPEPEWVKPAWVALVEILKRIESQPFHHFVGRTIFQKIAYVATEEGLPTDFEFQKYSYGPFSPQVKQAIVRLINNGLLQEEGVGGKAFKVSVGPTFHDAYTAYARQIEPWTDIIEKTADLFLRMNTRQAEVVSTVLFARRHLVRMGERQPSEREVFDAVMEWKVRRRPPLEEREVGSAVRNLAMLSWLDVTGSEDLPLPEEALAGV